MLSICILNWNNLSTLKRTLEVISTIKEFEWEVIVYDQNSKDGSREFLRHISSPQIKTILSDRNDGNSVSRNIMVRSSRFKYVLLLDADIVPIKGSFEAMVRFMEKFKRFVILGYDFNSYSDDWSKVTSEEFQIDVNDLAVCQEMLALTQYGIFRKKVLLEAPFPEFSPFDKPGWGGEDDIVGHAIYRNGLGLTGKIRNRVYFHLKGSSIPQLGEDLFRRNYIIRFIHTQYFKILPPHQQLKALKTKKLPKTKLNCNKYFWTIQENLGDVATDLILKELFEFFEFDPKEKRRLLMFGGTIFDHIDNANKLFGAKFKKILFFGVGVSSPEEIERGLKSIKKGKIKVTIVPRGPKTAEVLRERGVLCEPPCGDVLQLVSCFPMAENDSRDSELLILDIWNPFLIKPSTLNFKTIRVANDGKSFLDVPFYNVTEFISNLNRYSEVYSSQIHPYLIAALLGKAAVLHPKDWRAEDFKFFKSYKPNMTTADSIALRLEAQKNIQRIGISFFNNIQEFIPREQFFKTKLTPKKIKQKMLLLYYRWLSTRANQKSFFCALPVQKGR